MNEELETVISNEFNYSNAIITAESIGYLVEYSENLHKQILQLIADDELKNEKLKYEYKNYNYHKHFKTGFEIIIRKKGFSNIECTTYGAFLEAVSAGHLKEVDYVEVLLDLTYRRGQNNNLKDYENSFKLSFKPYDIIFLRKSNHNEVNMNQIEAVFNEILSKLPVANTVFYSK